MKYIFFKSTENKIEDSTEVHSLKIYKLTNKYINSLSDEMIESLGQLINTNLNPLPFLGSFLGNFYARLIDFKHSEDKLDYLFEYSTEKIEFTGSTPFKKIVHIRIECRHYLRHNLVLISSKDDIEDKLSLYVAALLPYYLITRTANGSLPGYKPPKWKEISLSLEELSTISSVLGEMLVKGIDKPLPLQDMGNKFISCADSIIRSVEVKPYRKNSYSIKIRESDITQRIVIDTKGTLKFNGLLHHYTIDGMVHAILALNMKLSQLLPIGTILHEYFELAHPDMYEEARLKQEKRIMEDFANLISLEIGYKKEEDISYLSFMTAFNLLINTGCSTENYRDSSGDYLFSYEVLMTFLRKYLKLKHNISLTDTQLESLVEKFKATISSSKNNLLL